MLTPSLSWNAPAISSLTKSIAASGRPPSLWSNMGEVVWILVYCLPPIGLGFVAHSFPYVAHRGGCSFPVFKLGSESTRLHGFGMLYYGAGALYSAMGSLAETDADLDNNPHRKTLCQTVRLDTRTVRLCAWTGQPYGQTVHCCMRTIRRCMRTVRLGSLGFAQYMAARAHVSVIH
jgi:hypothetical protein